MYAIAYAGGIEANAASDIVAVFHATLMELLPALKPVADAKVVADFAWGNAR